MTDPIENDWLSRTMLRVDAIMKEHGFVEEHVPAPQETAYREKARMWSKLVAYIAQLAKSPTRA